MRSLLITSFLFCTVQASAQSLEPGLWQTKESLKLNGIPLPESKEEICVTKNQAKDVKATIEKELKKKGCQLKGWTVKNQKLDAKVKCVNDDMDAEGKLSGDVSSKSYNLTGDIEGTYQKALPAQATLKISGEWVKNCSAKK
jgi:Protein of unknown function (DUF3617)